MIVDLVSPWLAAVDAVDSTHARSAFRNRHATLLESLRLTHAPALDKLPLATDTTLLQRCARRAADPATQQLLRDTLAHAADLGADQCRSVTLLAGDATGDSVVVLPRPGADAVLFIEALEDDNGLVVGLARACAALARWCAPDSASPLALRNGEWHDRWEASRNVPLREWIYAEGIGLHLAEALRGGLPSHELFGLNQAAFNRLREREKVFRSLLDADLDERGIGLLLRWLTPGSPLGPRTINDVVLPPMAGRYLAWRLTAERVARVGLRDAIRMEA